MVESPSYNVEKKEDSFEIRAYSSYILAQVDVESDFDSALRNGFEILAHYIFGGNRKKESIAMTAPVSEEKVSGSEEIPMMAPVTSEKISMTAPVTEEQAGVRAHRISFAMPSRFTLETLPEPQDPRIKFMVVESRRTVAIRFSGRLHEKLAIQKTEELRAWLSRNGIVPKSNFVVALYNPPFIPGIFRRNEIIVDI
ncbi:MAG: SOUL family heme-binding protein [Halobacteriota archaeon]